jgi:polysaccharide export outer membrane protein
MDLLSNLISGKKEIGSLLIAIAIILSSCVDTKKAVYFPDLKNDTITTAFKIPDAIIKTDDILSITVSSLNAEASSLFNFAASGPASSSSTSAVRSGISAGVTSSSYLVNPIGVIQFPVLGTIVAAGLTKEQLAEKITNELIVRKLLVEPVVIIRYLNFKITVLGEVASPSVFTIPNEKITLLEAISLAGDLTIYARRDNILVIREENGTKISKRISLNSTELLSSPYYYLKSNDVIYVEPGKSKINSTSKANQWLPIIFSSLTLAVILADVIIE